MKYDRLYNFISPVTGKIAAYSQFPAIPEKYIIIGNENNEPIVSPILISMLDDISNINTELTVFEGITTAAIGLIQNNINNIEDDITIIKSDITVIKSDINIINDNISDINVELTDIRLNAMDMRHDIDSLKTSSGQDTQDIHDAKFIIQTPDIRLPNAQSLSELENGVLGNTDGVIEILKRVSGPDSSTADNIARFDGETGQVIKDSKVKIDDDGELYANSLHVTNSIGNKSGFNASLSQLYDILYSLPTTAGFPTQMLTTPGIPGPTGSYQLYWSTPPSQITTDNPSDPSNPYPLYTTNSAPAPIGVPFPVPVFIPSIGLPFGAVAPTPLSIAPATGALSTPGNISGNDFKGNNADFDGDLSIDGILDSIGDISTQGNISADGNIESLGDISADGSVNAKGDIVSDGNVSAKGDINVEGDIGSLGNISANGNVSGYAFDFEDISGISDDFVRMEASFDLDHSYKIELPDAEPIMQEQIQPTDQRILQTAWRKMKPDQVNATSLRSTNTNDNLSITKLSWTELEVTNPITIDFIPATSTTNEKMVIGFNGGGGGLNIDTPYAVNLIYGTLNNIGGSFGGFNSGSKNYLIKVKTSYNHKLNGSNSAIGLFNRYDNGFILKNDTDTLNNCIFKIQSITDNIITDLLHYNEPNNSFNFLKPLIIPFPTLAGHPATKGYVDNKDVGVTQIIAGTGLTGGTITSSGTIALTNTGVAAGSYTNSNITIDSDGRITSASNGVIVDTGNIRFSQNSMYSTSGYVEIGSANNQVKVEGELNCDKALFLSVITAPPTVPSSNQGVLYVAPNNKLYYATSSNVYYIAG